MASILKNKTRGVVVGVTLCLGLSSYAYAKGSGGERNLNAVRLPGDDFIVFEALDNDFSNPDGCDRSDRVLLRRETEGADQKLSVALTALVAEKKVGVWLDGCSNSPWGYTIPVVDSLWILR
ncbi:hypothetical protein ACJJI5_13365 [Microbulbifer sp. EKSA008]|uniref:hypothetical protein n=1 Tax=Microbulbifer sp. EKSA008 TaxID=3243367 RepID=UPI004041A117